MAEVNEKRVGYAAIAFGVLAVLVAVLADPLGIGGEGFGLKQGLLLTTGVSVVLVGVAEVNEKRVGYAAIAFGVLALLVAVLADPLGIRGPLGIGGGEGFGWQQGLLLSSGVSVALAGVGVMQGWFAGLGRKKGGWRGDQPRRASAAHRSPDTDHTAGRFE